MTQDSPFAAAAAAFAAWVRGRRSLLLLTHERPDGDAFGALAGLALVLEAAGHRCTAYLRERPQPRYAFLSTPASLRTAADSATLEPAGFDGIIALDCARLERLELPPGWTPARAAARPLLNLDHHADNPAYGGENLVLPATAASCQILFELVAALGLPLPAAAADWFLAGIFMDTGAFRFANTTPEVLRVTARLVEAGGDYARVMDGLFFHEPLNRRLLAAELLQEACFHFNGRLLLVLLTPEKLAGFGVTAAETEGLIDTLRVIDGVQVTAMLQVEPGAVRVSLRARDPSTPVDEVAHALGGGGHRLAAGAKLSGRTAEAAELELLAVLRPRLAPAVGD
ncbi:MAG: bifunctional oligoribonuclease/PAP phosphatase NrnA [Lentisphaeria bacterium]|jgi:phosphoesterase RecJ-like protein